MRSLQVCVPSRNVWKADIGINSLKEANFPLTKKTGVCSPANILSHELMTSIGHRVKFAHLVPFN